ncbi:MAG: hypothetical protein IAF08_07445 [Rhizobacter sp.]|nr:hypothetical protein [Chlorobiales bacterium]
MTLTFSVEVPDSLYEKAKAAAAEKGETVEHLVSEELYRLFDAYWTTKSKKLTWEDYLRVLDKASDAEPEDFDKL